MRFFSFIALASVFFVVCFSTPVPDPHTTEESQAKASSNSKVSTKQNENSGLETATENYENADCKTKTCQENQNDRTKQQGNQKQNSCPSTSSDVSAVCGGPVIKPTQSCKCSSCSVLQYNEEIFEQFMKQTWFFYQGTRVKEEVDLDVPACSDWHLASPCTSVKIQFVKEDDKIVKKVWGSDGKTYSYFQSDVTVVSQECLILKDELKNVMVVPEGAQKAEAAEKKQSFIEAVSGTEYLILAAVKEEFIIIQTNTETDAQVFIGLRQNWYEKDNKDEITQKITEILEMNSIDSSTFITLTEKFQTNTNEFSSQETTTENETAADQKNQNDSTKENSETQVDSKAKSTAEQSSQTETKEYQKSNTETEAKAKSKTGTSTDEQGNQKQNSCPSTSSDDSAVCGGPVIKPTQSCKCSSCSVLQYNEEIFEQFMKQTWFFYQGTRVTEEVDLDVPACSDWHLASPCTSVKIQFVKEDDKIVKKVWGSDGKTYSYFQSDVTVVSQECLILKDELKNVMVVPEGAQKAEAAEKKQSFIEAVSGTEYLILAAVKEEFVIIRTNTESDAQVFIGLRQNWYEKDNKDEITQKITKVLEMNSIDSSTFVTLTEKFQANTNEFSSQLKEETKETCTTTGPNSKTEKETTTEVENTDDGKGNKSELESQSTSKTSSKQCGDYKTKAQSETESQAEARAKSSQNSVTYGNQETETKANAYSKSKTEGTGNQETETKSQATAESESKVEDKKGDCAETKTSDIPDKTQICITS